VLALLPLVVVKVYGYCQEESERQGQEKKERACRCRFLNEQNREKQDKLEVTVDTI